jgi:hypothetical protein
VIAAGPGARVALRDLATALDRQLLVAHAGAGALWAWLGGRRRIAAADVLGLASDRCSPELSLSLGEAAEALPPPG